MSSSPGAWSSDPSGYFPPTGQSSRVTGSWSPPERDKAWPVPQVKSRLKARKHGGQIPGDRIKHSPSLGSDQEGAELPGWWQWCHSRVPCVTLCGPDSACSGEGAGRGSCGSFPGTAGLPEGCPWCPPPWWWLSHLHSSPSRRCTGTGSEDAGGEGTLQIGVSPPQSLPCPGKLWDTAPDPQTLPVLPIVPRRDRHGGQAVDPCPGRCGESW